MIKKLQKKFISITAAALFAMILLVLAAVNGIFIFQTDRQLNDRLDMILYGQVLQPFPDGRRDFRDLPQDLRRQDGFFRFADRLHIRADGCTIRMDETGAILEIHQDAAQNYSEDELTAIASALFKKGKTHGWHQYFKYRIVTDAVQDRTEIRIGLVNASSDLYSIFTMLLISLFIGAASFLLVLLVILLASRRAVKPIAESYMKQKQFVTDAGHEFKTPLTVISANNELSRMIYGDSEWFDGIDRQVNKMNKLVHSMITLARMDEEQKTVFTAFNLSDAVYDTAKSFEGLLHSQGRVLTLDIEEDITCNGDEAKLRELLSILIDNAAKYCDERGKVAVSLSGGKQIRLRVVNDFADAAAFEPDKVFERFYRADRARTPDGSYGLGLSIAKSIAELHRGQISAKTLEHNRVMFEVILP